MKRTASRIVAIALGMLALAFSGWTLYGIIGLPVGVAGTQQSADIPAGTTLQSFPASSEHEPELTPPTVISPTPTPDPTDSPAAAPTASPSPEPVRKPSPTLPPNPGAGIVWYNGFADPRTISPATVSDPSSLTALVNKYWQLPADYVPDLAKAASSASQRLRPEANAAWDSLRAACRADTGVTLYIVSGYRSYATQKYVFQEALREKGIAGTAKLNAYPGRSEHQLGLAFDLGTTENPYRTSRFTATAAGKWLTANAHRFGIILRYPAGRESITGYAFEAWHYRYLGIEAATVLFERGITLEEYASP